MSADPSDLLRNEAGPLETALAAAMVDDLPVPVRAIMSPATTPARFLPFLAVHDGVLLWFPDWTEDRKREVVAAAPQLAGKVGTRAATAPLLGYVDAELRDVVSYPDRFVIGRSLIGRTPIGHPPFVARHLIAVDTRTPEGALVLARGVVGRRALRTPSREKLRRTLVALCAAKSPETEYRADHGRFRPLTLGDAPVLDGSQTLGGYVPRHRL